jgi:hypothetical protein
MRPCLVRSLRRRGHLNARPSRTRLCFVEPPVFRTNPAPRERASLTLRTALFRGLAKKAPVQYTRAAGDAAGSPEPVELDLAEVIRAAVELVAPAARAPGLEVALAVPARLPPTAIRTSSPRSWGTFCRTPSAIRRRAVGSASRPNSGPRTSSSRSRPPAKASPRLTCPTSWSASTGLTSPGTARTWGRHRPIHREAACRGPRRPGRRRVGRRRHPRLVHPPGLMCPVARSADPCVLPPTPEGAFESHLPIRERSGSRRRES